MMPQVQNTAKKKKKMCLFRLPRTGGYVELPARLLACHWSAKNTELLGMFNTTVVLVVSIDAVL